MIKLISTGERGTEELTQLISRVRWSGDCTQAARKLEFDMAVSYEDSYLPKNAVELGNRVLFFVEDVLLFTGYVFAKGRSHRSNEMTVTCFDGGVYLLKNQAAYNFKGWSAEEITRRICEDFEIETGELADTGIPQDFIAAGDTLYGIIMQAYGRASRQTGKKYLIQMKDTSLSVLERGSLTAAFELRSDTNIKGSDYSESVENMVSVVQIIDETDGWLPAVVSGGTGSA